MMLLRELASHIVIDPDAPRGRHKALVFERVLGYTLHNWYDLHNQIEVLAPAEGCPRSVDSHGRRFTADLMITGANGQQAIVRTGWIIRPREDILRLVTLWIEE